MQAELSEILRVLDHRLQQVGFKWRNVYKALNVLEFLLTQGSQECVRCMSPRTSQTKPSASMCHNSPKLKHPSPLRDELLLRCSSCFLPCRCTWPACGAMVAL